MGVYHSLRVGSVGRRVARASDALALSGKDARLDGGLLNTRRVVDHHLTTPACRELRAEVVHDVEVRRRRVVAAPRPGDVPDARRLTLREDLLPGDVLTLKLRA